MTVVFFAFIDVVVTHYGVYNAGFSTALFLQPRTVVNVNIFIP
jgi:hypothetical protein